MPKLTRCRQNSDKNEGGKNEIKNWGADSKLLSDKSMEKGELGQCFFGKIIK
jgi:hypothetical protein